MARNASRASFRAVSQLLWPDKDREVWFSLGENHEKVYRFGLHQLRNCYTVGRSIYERLKESFIHETPKRNQGEKAQAALQRRQARRAGESRPQQETRTTLKLIPYYAWANRSRSAMQVWIPYTRV